MGKPNKVTKPKNAPYKILKDLKNEQNNNDVEYNYNRGGARKGVDSKGTFILNNSLIITYILLK